jgi:hypothetical protein
MNFLPDDPENDAHDFGENDEDDDDASSVIDISDFLTEAGIAAATGTTVIGESAINDDGDTKLPGSKQHIIDEGLPIKESDGSTLMLQRRNNEKGQPVRIVMGDSVRRWRKMHRQFSRNAGDSHLDDSDSINKSLDNATESQEFAVLRQNTDSGPASSTRIINWEDSQLQVLAGGVQLVLKSTQNKANDEGYETKEIRTVESSSESADPLNSNKFMDVVAIWDPKRQEYRLEIPKFIAVKDSDRALEKSLGRAPTDKELATVDPLMQSRQAEALRKRKQSSKNTIRRPQKRGKNTTASKKSK